MMPIQIISDSTKASFAMEGMYATEKDEKNIMDVLTGRRTWQERIHLESGGILAVLKMGQAGVLDVRY